MLTDGVLMRLSKQQFLDILKKQLVHYVSHGLALEGIRSGDRWLDVRLAEEHANGGMEDSINIPLAAIRANTSRLDLETRYIVYCDTGRRSAAAAFLLTQRGFNVAVLEGGLNENAPEIAVEEPADTGTTATASVTPLPTAAATAPPRAGMQHQESRMKQIEDELNALRDEVQAYAERAAQLEAACRQEQLARVSLLARIDEILGRL